MKKYCINCRHIKYMPRDGESSKVCNHPNTYTEKETAHNKEIEWDAKKGNIYEKNKNNDCVDYKKNSLYFWIK